jgi:hypothetical protein
MSIRIVSQEQIRFDVDVESYNRIVRDVSNTVADRMPALVRAEMHDPGCRTVVNNIDTTTIAYQVAMQMDYHRVIEYAKTELVALLLADARFVTLLQRGINTATVGVINETVEIVTSRIENQTTNEGDI